MGQIFSPYGLRVLKKLGEGYFTGGMHTYPVVDPTVIASTGMYFGDPVGLENGSVVPLTASPTTPPPPGAIGVFQGAQWQDPIRGFVNSQYLPAGIMTAGATNVRVKVVDDPDIIMRVQTDGVVNYGANSIGENMSLLGFNNGSTVTGNSRVYGSTGTPSPTTPPLTAGPPIGGGIALGMRIVGFVTDAGPSPGAQSIPGDPFTDLLVTWNFQIHRYRNATGG